MLAFVVLFSFNKFFNRFINTPFQLLQLLQYLKMNENSEKKTIIIYNYNYNQGFFYAGISTKKLIYLQ